MSQKVSHAADVAVVAGDAFWSDAAPLALSAAGARAPDIPASVPSHHVLFATSGTSGSPKWIALGKPALLASAAAVNAHLGVTSASVWALALPVRHVGGFGVVARARAAGCGLEVFPHGWNARGFAGWLGERNVTHTSLVPTQAHDLVAARVTAPPGLLALVVGGGRLEVDAGRAARSLGWPVLASYGMTEAASQIGTQPLDALASVYQPAPIPVLAHWQVRGDAQDCLEIAGPALFSGTLEGGVYHPRAGDWYATRDRVAITAAGIIPRGRADALVKVAGELVDPDEIQARIVSTLGGGTAGVAIVALADARLGHRLVAAAEPDVPTARLASAIEGYNAAVPRSQRIAGPVRLDCLPRGELGKIQTARLREILAARGGAE